MAKIQKNKLMMAWFQSQLFFSSLIQGNRTLNCSVPGRSLLEVFDVEQSIEPDQQYIQRPNTELAVHSSGKPWKSVSISFGHSLQWIRHS